MSEKGILKMGDTPMPPLKGLKGRFAEVTLGHRSDARG